MFSCGIISLQQNKNIHKFGLKPTNPASLHVGSVESQTHTLTASRVVWLCVCVYSVCTVCAVYVTWGNKPSTESMSSVQRTTDHTKKNTTSINLCMRRRPLHRRGQWREARASRQTWPWDLMTQVLFAHGQRILLEQHLHRWFPQSSLSALSSDLMLVKHSVSLSMSGGCVWANPDTESNCFSTKPPSALTSFLKEPSVYNWHFEVQPGGLGNTCRSGWQEQSDWSVDQNQTDTQWRSSFWSAVVSCPSWVRHLCLLNYCGEWCLSLSYPICCWKWVLSSKVLVSFIHLWQQTEYICVVDKRKHLGTSCWTLTSFRPNDR